MTAPHSTALAKATASAARPEAELAHLLPGACVWYGLATRRCWGLVADRSGRHALIEAEDPAHLVRRLHRSPGWRLVSAPTRPTVQVPDRPPQAGAPAGSRVRLRHGPAGWTIGGLVPVQTSTW